MSELYDPLTWENLMAGVALRFEANPRLSLDDTGDLLGPGVYALYYTGLHPAYAAISGTERPVYVGKAVPKGSRKGNVPKNVERSTALRTRLKNHRGSINDAVSLSVDDFEYRSLGIVPVWITLAERFLAERYQPVWVKLLDGFGNKVQGGRRTTGKASQWDTLHPGRGWAMTRTRQKSQQDVLAEVQAFLEAQGGTP